MNKMRSVLFVSVFLVLFIASSVFAASDVVYTDKGPVLRIDEPNVSMEVPLDFLTEIIGMVMEHHIERNEFSPMKMSLGIARGFLEGIGVRKLILSGLSGRAATKSGSLRVVKNGVVLDIPLGVLIAEIKLAAENGKLRKGTDKHLIVLGMVKGFLGSLDKYSRYLTNKEAKELFGRLEGKPEKQGGPEPQTVASGMLNVSGKKIGVIKIICFDKNTQKQYEVLLRELLSRSPEYLIYDLRDNPGGYLQSVGEALAMTVGKEKTIFSVEDVAGKIVPVRGLEEAGEGIVPSAKTRIKKIVCLVNRGTASAGEVMAAGIRDILGAKLIGEKTYGKGTGWSPYEMKSGRGVCIITDMRWYTPNGKCIKEVGLTPDLIVKLTLQDFFAEKDPQLEAALKELLR
jgi:hypothetical protein